MQSALKYTLLFLFIFCVIHVQAGYATEESPAIKEANEEKDIGPVEQRWTGVDVSIVGKYAEKYGHPPRKPYINTDQGDLLLFVFTTAGVIGGFIIGYNFRKLFFDGNHDQYSKTKDEVI